MARKGKEKALPEWIGLREIYCLVIKSFFSVIGV
jgi:hypothetical protein